MESIIAWLFLAFLATELAVESLLNEANMRHLGRQWREGRLPELFAASISRETHDKSVRYALARGRFARWSAGYGTGLTLLVLFGGVLPWVDSLARGVESFLPVPEAAGIVFCLAVGGVFAVMSLPLRVYSTFVLEERFGFNKMDVRTFVMDRIKGAALAVVLGAPFLFGVLWLMKATGAYWWVYVFAFIFAFQCLMMVVYPTWIAPLFNRFEPVADDSLRDAIADLAQRVGLRTSGIYTMDGSKRSGHSNAYFTGLGKAKRIVLFDTLLQQLDRRQLLSVLAHELGHYKMRHVLKKSRPERLLPAGRAVGAQRAAGLPAPVPGLRTGPTRPLHGAGDLFIDFRAVYILAGAVYEPYLPPARVRGRRFRGTAAEGRQAHGRSLGSLDRQQPE